jgi:hypothetical protein
MKDRIARLAILILAVGFAASPIFSNGFGGFYRESFPVQVARWPAQPVGWAFSIWGLIYLALIATAAWAVLRPATMPGWRRATLPLGISLVIGLFWIEAAMRSPLLATAMILPMAAGAIVAMHRVGPDWREHAALGLYGGSVGGADRVWPSVHPGRGHRADRSCACGRGFCRAAAASGVDLSVWGNLGALWGDRGQSLGG